MRILVDAGFPRTVSNAPNSEGIQLGRVDDEISDSDLIERAANEGYEAVVVLDQGMVSRDRLRVFAADLGVTIVCSVTDDPFEAESNLLHALGTMAAKVRRSPGAVVWLRKDGLHADI